MKYISRLKVCSILLPLLLISACQSVPDRPEEQLSEDAEVAVQKTVNPYLLNRPSVSSAVTKRFTRAQEAIDAENWAQAEFELQWLTVNHPNLSGPYLSLAVVYQAISETEKAELAFKGAIAANSNNVNAYNQYGIYLRKKGEFSNAEKQYKQALELWPDYPTGHINLAILYDLYMGELPLAIEFYQRYQALLEQPDNQVAGWLIDAERRLKRQQQALANQ